ncbi:WYL domain-containing protein [Pseudohalocynthiibacter aestuariivivens]|uniref:WYL domain-containing protein n=1 Tax=Roseovarius pelagicus TaxID=2980108 RepID=A0ABY6DC96_9RHOB|nr:MULTISPECIES: WYL domain-containing protein [Rhodobacterales]QIE45448.1 WYL domain-containing protein [Pseudohalocynthiibacter aestuariivivens]UXX82633.1 WYL domain-containing protein [Roseovarius pelagicus]
MTRTHRLFQLMQTLRTVPPPATAAALADALGVTPRTVYRDIDTLRGLGAVIDGAAGFGYTLIEDAALPPLSFDAEELEALVLGLREVQQVGDPALAEAAGAALSKMRARLPPGQAHRLQHAVLSAHRYAPMPEPGIDVRVLRQAAWDERTVRFDYCDVEGRATTRNVDPLSIVYMQASHCLLAWCHLRRAFRAFRLDRMDGLEVLETSFRPRRVPLLRECLAEMGSCPPSAPSRTASV